MSWREIKFVTVVKPDPELIYCKRDLAGARCIKFVIAKKLLDSWFRHVGSQHPSVTYTKNLRGGTATVFCESNGLMQVIAQTFLALEEH